MEKQGWVSISKASSVRDAARARQGALRKPDLGHAVIQISNEKPVLPERRIAAEPMVQLGAGAIVGPKFVAASIGR